MKLTHPKDWYDSAIPKEGCDIGGEVNPEWIPAKREEHCIRRLPTGEWIYLLITDETTQDQIQEFWNRTK